MKKYKVIWFDDEFRTLNIIKENASLSGITLVGFDNAKDGIEELEKNFLDYHGAIVDGKFYSKPGQSGDSIDDMALFSVGSALDRLNAKKVIPWFILSGQISFTKEINPYAKAYKDNKVYDKTKEEDIESLWNDLKMEADLQLDTQIQYEFAKVFEVCDSNYIGEDAKKPLLQILKSIREPLVEFDDELYFTQIRIILESMFRAANKTGLLHDSCIKAGKVNLTESSLFLSGEHTKYAGVKCSKSHFSKIISDQVKSILFITGAASHTVDAEISNNINLEEYRKTVNTPYLLYSLTFQLMDILIWFKNYADANADKAKNKLSWESITNSNDQGQWIKGDVTRIASNGYGTFQPKFGANTLTIIPAKIKQFALNEGQPIEVTTKVDLSSGKTLIEDIRSV
jgi:hypothetical protein